MNRSEILPNRTNTFKICNSEEVLAIDHVPWAGKRKCSCCLESNVISALELEAVVGVPQCIQFLIEKMEWTKGPTHLIALSDREKKQYYMVSALYNLCHIKAL